MTLPQNKNHQSELRRRVADCRERLRRNRTAQKINGRAVLISQPEVANMNNAPIRNAREDNKEQATILTFSLIRKN